MERPLGHPCRSVWFLTQLLASFLFELVEPVEPVEPMEAFYVYTIVADPNFIIHTGRFDAASIMPVVTPVLHPPAADTRHCARFHSHLPLRPAHPFCQKRSGLVCPSC